MAILAADMHIHSCYSFDSLMEPKKILERAQDVGLNIIAITDHGTIEGAWETKKLATNDTKVQVIIGEEIGTDIGDIIGLGLKEAIPSGRHVKWREVLEEINRQGGTSVLSHPYRDHRGDIHPVAAQVDIIESFNSRCTRSQNRMARELSPQRELVGSDAHFYSEIGHAITLIERDMLWGIPLIERYSSRAYVLGSHIIKFMKKKGWIK